MVVFFTDTEISSDSKGRGGGGGGGGESSLPLFMTSTRSWKFRHLRLFMWDDHHIACNYQTVTHWDLAPWEITIWPINDDDAMLVSVYLMI